MVRKAGRPEYVNMICRLIGEQSREDLETMTLVELQTFYRSIQSTKRGEKRTVRSTITSRLTAE